MSRNSENLEQVLNDFADFLNKRQLAPARHEPGKILGSENIGVTSCNATISPKNIGVKSFLQLLPYHAGLQCGCPNFLSECG